ncbi:unnamed protein product [Brassica oleracea]
MKNLVIKLVHLSYAFVEMRQDLAGFLKEKKMEMCRRRLVSSSPPA